MNVPKIEVASTPTTDAIEAPPPTPVEDLEPISLKRPPAANDQPEPLMVDLDEETMEKAAEPVADVVADLSAPAATATPGAAEPNKVLESAKRAVVEAKREVSDAAKTVKKSEAVVETAKKESEAASKKEIAAKAKVEATAAKLGQSEKGGEKAALKQELIQNEKAAAIASATKIAAQATTQQAEETLTKAKQTMQTAEAKKELGAKAVELVKAASAKKAADEKSMYLLEKLSVTTKDTYADLCIGPVRDAATNSQVMAICVKTGPANTCPTTFSEGSCVRLQSVSSDVLGINVVKKW
jgi:hypothetical protein